MESTNGNSGKISNRHSTCSKLRIAFAILGIFAGITAGPMFLFKFKNIQAGAWGIISAIFAATVLHLHWLVYKGQVRLKYSSYALQWMFGLGLIAQIVSLAAMFIYLVIAIQMGQDLGDIPNNNYIRAVWSFMTWKWSVQMMTYCWLYRKRYYSAYAELEA